MQQRMLLGKCKLPEDQQLHTSRMSSEQVVSIKKKIIKGHYQLQNAITIHPEFSGPNGRRDYILIYSCRFEGKSCVNISHKML